MSPRRRRKVRVSDAPHMYANFTLEREGRKAIRTLEMGKTAIHYSTADAREGIVPFIDKRLPTFTGR
jgi:hypothetical protein